MPLYFGNRRFVYLKNYAIYPRQTMRINSPSPIGVRCIKGSPSATKPAFS